MARNKLFLGIVILGIFFLSFSTASARVTETIFSEDWEYGSGDWDITNGVWQVGAPTAGPGSAHGGSQCAGTVLDGNYPRYTDSRLISPLIRLPEVSGDEELRLRFWHWFSYSSGDYDHGYVQIQEYDEMTQDWSDWKDISGAIGYVGSTVWSPKSLDVSAYAGKKVRIGFYHTDDNDRYLGAGWYIDDIALIKIEPEFTVDFESGWGDWHEVNGVWDVGTPSTGPGDAHGGSQCAGTLLDGNYPSDTDSRLISPLIRLPEVSGDEELRLRFWHWFSYSIGDYDHGYVQIQEYDEVTQEWLEWKDISGAISNSSPVWSLKAVDITAYAGQKVRIGFYHTSVLYSIGAGWYVDDIAVIKMEPEFTGDFEDGWGDWSADHGVWEVGTPTAGPEGAHGGSQCAGTVLDGNYPNYNTDSRLISPSIRLPEVSGDEEIHLRFWHWFSFDSGDAGYVQISVYDEVTAEWSAWDDIYGPISWVSAGWTPKKLPLTAYAGQKVRIGFYHIANSYSTGTGWYIDDIRLPGVFLIPCEGDFDNDGDVDGSNLAVFAADFGRTDCSLQNFCDGDFDGDGDVDGSDLAIFAADFGKTDCFN